MGDKIIITPRAYHHLLATVKRVGEPTSPRGMLTYEIINANMLLRNPLDRVVPNVERRNNIAFAIAEWVSMMFGITDIGFFTQFIHDYDKFSSDGQHLDGAYGQRIHFTETLGGAVGEIERSQIDQVIEKLRKDHDTRQAVISIYTRHDLWGAGGTNTPCTISLQFMNRSGKLHMITTMRSNDVVKGLTYDMFCFTMLQEYVTRRLGLELGTYHHNAGSLHLYDYDLPMVDKMKSSWRWPYLMNRMPVLTDSDMELFKSLITIGMDHSIYFFGAIQGSDKWSSPEARNYLVCLAAVMKSFVERKRNPPESLYAQGYVVDKTLKFVLRQWLSRAGTLGVPEQTA